MNEIEFKKGLESLKNVRMTDAEKARVLKNVLETPVESPYVRVSTFSNSFFQLTHMRLATTLSLVVAISFGGLVYASDDALPGETLYQMKVSFVEPILDQFNRSVEKKVVWEEEKVERRIKEAEALLDLDELDEARTEELERRVERSSQAFVTAVKEEAKLKSAGLVEAEAEAEIEEQVEKRKQEFRERFGFKSEATAAFTRSATTRSEDSEELDESKESEVSDSSDVQEDLEESDDSTEDVEKVDNDRKERIERLKRKAFEAIEEFGVRE